MLIKDEDFLTFLQQLANQKIGEFDDVIVPARAPDLPEGQFCEAKLDEHTNVVLQGYRPVDPLKILFYLFRERVTGANYPVHKRIIAGVKACDLKALNILDDAMINGDFVDPAYQHWREHSLIISSDCNAVNEYCHCTLNEGAPFAEQGFDLNIAGINQHYLVSVGSDKGRQLYDLMKEHFPVQEAGDTTLDEIKDQRVRMLALLNEKNVYYTASDSKHSLRLVDKDEWDQASTDCVGCGACTNICPTCYCLILNDESKGDAFVKIRSYDSCQLSGYARVAGGGTPRPVLADRFRNRYLCKFDYMKQNFGHTGCTGCGRCTETCAAEINFRKVLLNIQPLPQTYSKSPVEQEVEVP